MNQKKLFGRIAQYSAASLAFVGVHEHANAFVVYNDLDPDSLIISEDTILLDIDQDGINDIMFWIESKISSIESSGGEMIPYQYRFAYAQGIDVNAIMGKQNSMSGYVFNSAYQFNSGDYIVDTLPKFTAKARLGGFVSLDGSVIYEGGPWSGITDGYLGIRFKISGATHFAWIRLSVGVGGSSILISELAYDNQVDAGIVAGTTVGIAEETNLPFADIYSNNNIVYIDYPAIEEAANCLLFDINGRIVQSVQVTGSHTQLYLPELPSGIYIVTLMEKNRVMSKKILLTQ